MRLFTNNESYQNVFVAYIDLLGVKYTNKYANKYFNEHPHKYNLFGLSEMLTNYGVHNTGLKITNKEDLHSLEPPFIAHAGNQFVTVKSVSENKISYYWQEKTLTVPLKDFFDIWSGVVLIAETDETSSEPNYSQHKKEERVASVLSLLLLLAGVILTGNGLYENLIGQNWGITILLILNLTGIYIGYLLIQKQINIHSSIADKICSLFAQSDCNNVLNSPAARFMGVIGWSELGCCYFLSNTFILLFAPHFLLYLALFNVLSLPYSIWSIWYQKIKAKAWCPLCLIVLLLFWLLFITNISFGFIQTPDISVSNIMYIGSIYGIPFILTSLLLPHLVESRKLTTITQQYNSLMTNDKIFLGLLKEQAFYEVENVSTIILGNPNAKNTITIFTNPHCNPCSRMHKNIEKILIDTKSQFRIQYILSTFSDKLKSSCEFFLFVNKLYSEEERDRIYNEWFDNGKYDKETFFKQYGFVENDNISDEFREHLEWNKRNKLRATPTILFNGYELPEMFFQRIELLAYFTDL